MSKAYRFLLLLLTCSHAGEASAPANAPYLHPVGNDKWRFYSRNPNTYMEVRY